VDALVEAGYTVHLVHTSAVPQHEGLKFSDDRHDARWLAHLLRLGLLPTGYIYPKQDRAVGDLLRKRCRLVRQRTANLLSVQNLVARTTSQHIRGNALKRLSLEQLADSISDERWPHSMSRSNGSQGRLVRGDDSSPNFACCGRFRASARR
jgi:hypothetical protein